MPKSFQEWASKEIDRLRAEADTLESIMRKYLEAEARAAKTNGAEQPSPPAPHRDPPKNPSRRGPQPVKNALMLDFINKAGARGVTTEEVYVFAKEGPIGIERNPARAMLWGLYRQGRVVKREDRYYGAHLANPGSENPGFTLEH